jgi:segregation and condensation protein A
LFIDYNCLMSHQVIGRQTESYQVSTDVYEGPLDLLLELIERAELDITTLAIAKVTDQYLTYLKNLTDRDPAEVSAFLVIAARLIQIKSAALLPRSNTPAPATDEEDVGEALARLLIQYRRFKQIAGWLEQRNQAGLRTHLRLATPVPRVEGKIDLEGITLHDLIQAARSVFYSRRELPLNSVINVPRITIREKIQIVLNTLKHTGKTTFETILSNRNRIEVVVTFLALLELIKRHIIEAQQERLFSDIALEPLGDWNENEETDLEFEE